MKLSAPWITYVNKIKGLFIGDPEVGFQYDEESYSLKVYVSDLDKAEALKKLMPTKKEFGNVVLSIEVVANDQEAVDYLELFRTAFKDNPNIAEITSVKDPFGSDINYVVFKKDVVQFFNDDTSDIHGVCSTLNEDSAREVFGNPVYFCTDIH